MQVIRDRRLVNGLTKVKAGSLREVLFAVLKAQRASKKEFDELYQEIARIDKENSHHIERIGLVYFKPFGEGEFENSFALTLLDGRGNGILITQIHSRDHSRVYCKEVLKGKSKTDLSIEEAHAISKAMKS